ncbi:MAG: pyridoxamine 5'-phosphate oxidase family protein [Syntrophomonadaceae bacterium]|nr:pyridoxamine 5'-phosphate oxidase family protein [Syntrophomonadaceae bacterium]MDD3023440.1 pyridoxamine 5'-phosphate oxidase family protein [Syntrophomonadaceae bacterium]
MNISAKDLARDLMEVAEAAYLTTMNSEGFPETRAMFNLRRKEQFPQLSALFQENRDNFLIYFTTNTSSRKIEQLRGNPNASVYYCWPGEWRGLNLVGNIEIVEDWDVKRSLWQDGWEMYYPGGFEDPGYAVIRMQPRFARYYHQLQMFQIDF